MRQGYNPGRSNYRNSRLTIPAPRVIIPKPVPMKVYVPHKAVPKKVYYPHKAVSHGKAYYPSKVYNPYKKAVNAYKKVTNQYKKAVNTYKKVANQYKKVHNPYTDVYTPYRAHDVNNSYHRNVNRRAYGTYTKYIGMLI